MNFIIEWICPCWFETIPAAKESTKSNEWIECTSSSPPRTPSPRTPSPRTPSPYQDFIVDPPSPLSPDSWEQV